MEIELNVEKMRQFLEDFRDNDPDFCEKIMEAIRKSLSDNSSDTLFWKIGNKFYQTDVPLDVMLINHFCDSHFFIVPVNWANHCGWISFDEDEDGNEIIMCPSQDPENPHVVYNFYELWDKVLDYYDFDIDTEIERIIDYLEKGYTNR
ncbi:MAG: hypothetical protein PHS04_18105 [Tissierellia bacterium]|nr:hypothetical protein [Tissierellia bacterium]